MNLLRKKIGRLPLGIWMALIALILISFAWLMQAYSLYNWESAIKLGLQNGSFSGDAAEKLRATKEKGEAIADLIWPMPLTFITLFGILIGRLPWLQCSYGESPLCWELQDYGQTDVSISRKSTNNP